jgi:hypothetical protein
MQLALTALNNVFSGYLSSALDEAAAALTRMRSEPGDGRSLVAACSQVRTAACFPVHTPLLQASRPCFLLPTSVVDP